MKKVILCCVLFFLILAIVQPSLTGKNRRRNQRKKSSSSEITTTSSSEKSDRKEVGNQEDRTSSHIENSDRSGRGSRRKSDKRGRRRKKLPILKTSMRAKKITERRYLKRDWCKSQPVRQHLRTKSNCHGMIINQFCYGQCNSFYIPKDLEIDPDQEIAPDYFKSCSFCKPKKLEWVSVRLRCKNIEATRMPRFITKKIKRVKGCTCIAVPDLEAPSEDEVEITNPEPPTSNTLVLATIKSER